LPLRPLGQANDLDRDGAGGVQTYAVDFQINLVGDPFLSRLEMQGWPTAITSLKVETGTNEVVGGQLLAWSPDADQRFPVGFGPDGLLFTEDDPSVRSIRVGRSSISTASPSPGSATPQLRSDRRGRRRTR
jgi:hypothetical protein